MREDTCFSTYGSEISINPHTSVELVMPVMKDIWGFWNVASTAAGVPLPLIYDICFTVENYITKYKHEADSTQRSIVGEAYFRSKQSQVCPAWDVLEYACFEGVHLTIYLVLHEINKYLNFQYIKKYFSVYRKVLFH